MTVTEMSNEFDVRYNNKTNNEGEGFIPMEKSLLLSYAQELIFEEYAPIADNTIATKDYFNTLKKSATLSPVPSMPGPYPNSWIFYRPADLKYIRASRCNIVFNENSICHDTGDEEIVTLIKQITEDYYGFNIKNSFKKPYKELLWHLNNGNEDMFIGDESFTVNKWYLRYYRKFRPIIVRNDDYTTGSIRGYDLASNTLGLSSEFHEDLHSKIIHKAILIATKSTKDQLGYQLAALQEKNT